MLLFFLICLLPLDVINIKAPTTEPKRSKSKSAVRVVQNEGWETGVVPHIGRAERTPGRASLVGPAH